MLLAIIHARLEVEVVNAMAQLNGIDVDELREYVASAARDTAVADRDPVVIARWVGGDRAEVTFQSGEASVLVGGDGPSAMKLVLASLAACDVDLVLTRAALLGVEVESLTVEAVGHFNVRRYLGLDTADGPGYDRIAYTVRLKTTGATPGQLAELRRACEQASPVGDTLQRRVALDVRFDAR
jgi:uncharacterized OsmC-like protein